MAPALSGLRLLAAAAGMLLGASGQVRLIIDTDLSTDVGDMLALCAAHKLEDLGHAKIEAVMHNTGLPAGVGAIATVNAYYGRADIPIGAYKGPFLNPYSEQATSWDLAYARGFFVEPLVQRYPAKVLNNSQVPEAVELYRRVLASMPDSSAVIASIGFLGNLASLLGSPPDSFSALNGAELISRKVREVVIMGGRYPDSSVMHYQWNFGGGCPWGSESCPQTPAWTKAVVDGWPEIVPMTFSGYEVGTEVLIGGQLQSSHSERSPCRVALEYHSKVDHRCPPCPSWDAVTVQYAVLGLGRWGERHRGGVNSVNGTDGANIWVDGKLSHQSYLTLLPGQRKALAAEIESLVCSAPALVI